MSKTLSQMFPQVDGELHLVNETKLNRNETTQHLWTCSF